MISYQPFYETLLRENITECALIFKHGIPANTLHRMKHGKPITTRYGINNSCRILLLLISWQSLYYPDFLKSYSSPSITSPQSCTPSLNQYVRLASKSFTVIGFIRYFSSTHSLTMRWFPVFTFGNFQACSCKAFIYAVSDGFQFSPKSLLEKTLCSFTHSIIHFFALSIIQ